MTIKSKKFFVFFLMLALWATLPISVAFAKEKTVRCSKANMDDQRTFMKDTAVKNAKTMIDSLEAYNNAAKEYISNCHSQIKLSRPTILPSTEDYAAARVVGADIIGSGLPGSLYKYTGISWDAEADGGAECEIKRKQAKILFDKFKAIYLKAMRSILAAREKNYKCSCNESGSVKFCTFPHKSDQEILHQNGDCLPFTTYHAELASGGGPLASVFSVILRTLSSIAHVAWTAVTPGLIKVVAVFFLVLLAFEALKSVAGMAGASISSFLKNVLTIGLKVAITIALLHNSSIIYGYFISPVIQGGLDLGLEMAESSGNGVHCSQGSNLAIASSEEFDPKLLSKIDSTVKCFGSSASITPAIGRGLLCNGWHAGPLGMPDFSMWFSGLIMLLFGLMIWLAISFYLIDCTVQLGMLSAVIPLLIACWPFKMTQNYSYKGVKMMMNTFFNYVMMGVVLLLGTEIISYAATGNNTADLDALIEALNNNDIDGLKKLTDLSGFQILILIASSIFALKMISSVNDIADQFSRGGSGDIGAKLGGLATSAATSLGKAAGGKVLGGAATVGKNIADATGVTSVAKKAVGAVQSGNRGFWRLAGRIPFGKYQNQQRGIGGGGGGAPGGDAPGGGAGGASGGTGGASGGIGGI